MSATATKNNNIRSSGPRVSASGIRAGNGPSIGGPGTTSQEERFTRTLKYIIWMAVIFAIGYWAIRELIDYYPSITSSGEGFADLDTRPEILSLDPRPVNNPRTNNSNNNGGLNGGLNGGSGGSGVSGGIDMDVLRSHRYYDVDIRKQTYLREPEPEYADKSRPTEKPFDSTKPEFAREKAPLTNLDTLTQEMPTTYFIDLLSRVMPLSIVFPDPEPIRFLLAHQPGGASYNPQTPVYRWDRIARLTPQQLTKDPALKHLFETAKMNIITAINLQVLAQKESHAKHPFSTFRIIQSEFINLLRTDDGELRMTINLVLHRPFKTHTFNIQARISIPLPAQTTNPAAQSSIQGRVSSLELVGSTIQNEVKGMVGQPRPYLGDILAQQQAQGIAGAPLTDNPHADIYPGMDVAMAEPQSPIDYDASRAQAFKEAQTKLEAATKGVPLGFLERTRDGGISKDPLDELTASGKYLPLNYNGDYKCFTVSKDGTIREDQSRGVSAISCQSADPQTGMVGVWDNPCSSDDECPFWRANKNYTNGFGGCQANGRCQLPAGLDQYQVGFKKYHKAGVSKTECYNCPRDPLTGLPRFNCCAAQEQKQANKQMLSPDYRGGSMLSPDYRGGSMLSPDYRFAGDEQTRNQPNIVKELAAKGLAPA